MCEGSSGSIPSPTLGNEKPFLIFTTSVDVVMPHCGFHLHFSDA
jgi:hypothetical protein